ncbi:hypothetical protein LJC63_01285 [Ruminococcaceae bacterium OttesenSCG-928-L11]|nr:hypothetical protein [Ruminococcaceae bacterium OttesenSCG-928-L11]
MDIHYLGTAAGECVPGMFCTCDTCQRSRELGGRNIRTRFQIAIDETLLLDFGPDTYFHVIHQGLPLWNITTCLITHNHTDHLRAEDFELRREKIAHGDLKPLHVYATAPSARQISTVVDRFRLSEQNRVFLHDIKPFVSFESDGYRITPLKAAHNPESEPVFYQIEAENQRILLAHDTGWFPEETWEYLKNAGIPFDFVSLDCTGGINEEAGYKHMAFVENIRMRDALYAHGLANTKTTFCLSHFSHNGRAVYDDFAPLVQREGFVVAYDGLRISL